MEGSPLLADRARAEHPGLVVHRAMFEDFDPGPVYDAVLALHVMEHVDAPARADGARARLARPGRRRWSSSCPTGDSLHRRLAVLMGIQAELDDLSAARPPGGPPPRVRPRHAGRRPARPPASPCSEEFGFTLKTVPNAMMLDWPPDLMDALTGISPDLPPGLLANIGVRAVAAA